MRISTSMTSLRVNFPEAVFVPLITELLSLARGPWNLARWRTNSKSSLQTLCATFAGSDPNQHRRR